MRFCSAWTPLRRRACWPGAEARRPPPGLPTVSGKRPRCSISSRPGGGAARSGGHRPCPAPRPLLRHRPWSARLEAAGRSNCRSGWLRWRAGWPGQGEAAAARRPPRAAGCDREAARRGDPARRAHGCARGGTNTAMRDAVDHHQRLVDAHQRPWTRACAAWPRNWPRDWPTARRARSAAPRPTRPPRGPRRCGDRSRTWRTPPSAATPRRTRGGAPRPSMTRFPATSRPARRWPRAGPRATWTPRQPR